MRKLLFILSFILILVSISMLGYKVVSANTRITQEKNIIELQQEKEKYLTPYGYTLDNPNIIIDPYGISPLTAMILFETDKNKEITIMIKEKDGTIKIQNTFKDNTKHYIPVYGLYPDTENEVLIQYGNKTKTYKIKTNPLPKDFKVEQVINQTNNLSFLNTNGYIYALDENNEVRWYLSEKYLYNISNLSNGKFLIPTSDLNNNKHPLGIMEIDLLGKVYKQYNIENGYYGSFVEKDNSYFILSENLIEIDKQTGQTIKVIELENIYNNLTYSQDTNIITLQNNTETLSIDLTTNEKNYSSPKEIIINKDIPSPIYTINNYIITKGIAFKADEETKESNKKIYLLKYKKIDATYKKYNIKITQESEYLKIKGDFNNKEVYIILEKFLDKKVYDIYNNNSIINLKSLSGKYSIYISINGKIYKTDRYVQL